MQTQFAEAEKTSNIRVEISEEKIGNLSEEKVC